MATKKKLIQVRLTDDVRQQLEKLAELESRSLSNLVEVLVKDGLNIRLATGGKNKKV